MGPEAQEAVPKLQEMLKNATDLERRRIEEAIKRIKREPVGVDLH
jgi:hypothetical protein